VVYVSPRPDDTSYEGAAVLAFALSTAAMGLFHESMLGPAQPTLEGDRLELVGLGKVVLALTMQCSTVIRLTATSGLRVKASSHKISTIAERWEQVKSWIIAA
jgi:hypothetical protein